MPRGWQTFLACEGSHIDNAATSRTPHEWENLASHLEHANEVNLDDLLAFTSVEFIKGQITAEISRIVDKDVDAGRLTDNRSKSPCDLIGFRNIDAQALRTVEFNRTDIPNPDFSPGSYKLGCDRPTDSPSATGYDRCLARKSKFGSTVIQSTNWKRIQHSHSQALVLLTQKYHFRYSVR
jgi:hypothetical protein